jgi:hypothetical protein
VIGIFSIVVNYFYWWFLGKIAKKLPGLALLFAYLLP